MYAHEHVPNDNQRDAWPPLIKHGRSELARHLNDAIVLDEK